MLLLKKIRYKFKLFWKKVFSIRATPSHFIHETVIFTNKKNVEIGNYSRINEYVILKTPVSKLRIGEHSHLGPFTVVFTGTYGIYIGDYVMVAPHCVFAEGSHRTDKFDVPMLQAGDYSRGPIIIEDDVWIGANCTILHNVKIGRGAIIGANSLVNKDVEPYSIVGGVPIKKIGQRK